MYLNHYHLDHEEKAIVQSETGALVRPNCWIDLLPYHSYLSSKEGRKKEAQMLLRDVFNGEKVISKMIAHSQKVSATALA